MIHAALIVRGDSGTATGGGGGGAGGVTGRRGGCKPEGFAEGPLARWIGMGGFRVRSGGAGAGWRGPRELEALDGRATRLWAWEAAGTVGRGGGSRPRRLEARVGRESLAISGVGMSARRARSSSVIGRGASGLSLGWIAAGSGGSWLLTMRSRVGLASGGGAGGAGGDAGTWYCCTIAGAGAWSRGLIGGCPRCSMGGSSGSSSITIAVFRVEPSGARPLRRGFLRFIVPGVVAE